MEFRQGLAGNLIPRDYSGIFQKMSCDPTGFCLSFKNHWRNR